MKYFLALFCIISSPFVFGMDASDKHFDDVTRQILKQYLKVRKKEMLNEDGINITVHESKTNGHVTLLVQVDEESRHVLAELLRREANKSPKTSHTQCRGSLDAV